MTIRDKYQEKGTQALQIAEAVAHMPEVIAAMHQQHPSTTIQPITERLRRELGTQFIVVANMNLIRYSHPNPKLIGKKMVGENDQDDLDGQTSITTAAGTLGLSIRGKAPIFDANSQQIGVVSVGFLVRNIWKQIAVDLTDVVGLSTVAFAFSLIGAHLLSGHVKRRIFGMEPYEIAYMVQEQSSILQSIQEGIVAVDSQGHITACNQQAHKILGLTQSEVLGQYLRDVVPHRRLCDVIAHGPDFVDQPMIIGTTLIVVNRVPVQLNDEVIGAVVTFRDKMQLDQMEERLRDIEHYADALRSQRHEFMNRLHSIAGLIQLGEYELVGQLIDEINGEQNQLLAYFANRIRDPAVLAIIIGKIHTARELGIQLTVDPESELADHCPQREIVVTVLGNALDNAFEAMAALPSHDREPTVSVYVSDAADEIKVSVRDSGPGIDPRLGNRIFDDGVTTKGAGRGFGLSLCSQLVKQANGELSIVSSARGAVLEMVIPKGSLADVS